MRNYAHVIVHLALSGLSQDHYAFKMIDGMIQTNPESRWKLEKVLDALRTKL